MANDKWHTQVADGKWQMTTARWHRESSSPHMNLIPSTMVDRRWRQKVRGVVTPSPVGPAMEKDGTPSPPAPSPAMLGPLTTKIVQSMILPIFAMTVVS